MSDRKLVKTVKLTGKNIHLDYVKKGGPIERFRSYIDTEIYKEIIFGIYLRVLFREVSYLDIDQFIHFTTPEEVVKLGSKKLREDPLMDRPLMAWIESMGSIREMKYRKYWNLRMLAWGKIMDNYYKAIYIDNNISPIYLVEEDGKYDD